MITSPGGGRKHLGPLIGSVDQGTCSTRFTVFVAATGELVTYHQVGMCDAILQIMIGLTVIYAPILHLCP